MLQSLRAFLLWFALTAVFLVCALFLSWRYLEHWGTASQELSEIIDVELRKGETLSHFSSELESSGVIESKLLFRIWVKLFSDYSRFQAGKYRFEDKISPAQVVDTVLRGETYTPVEFIITIPEGFTVQKVIDRAVQQGLGEQEELARLVSDKMFLKELSIPGNSLEGFLYPATYPFSTLPTPKEFFERLVATFWDRLPVNYVEAIQEKGLSLLEAVTMASLIELETSHRDERFLVAEVIWNRLERGMPLGIDAAVIYGIKGYEGDIRRVHLEDATNPYNTRIHKGLPPGPICSPSTESLEAVLNPTKEGYLYYVLDAEKLAERRHSFSKTLKRHNARVRKLLAR